VQQIISIDTCPGSWLKYQRGFFTSTYGANNVNLIICMADDASNALLFAYSLKGRSIIIS
jgi:hypothetical protein